MKSYHEHLQPEITATNFEIGLKWVETEISQYILHL